MLTASMLWEGPGHSDLPPHANGHMNVGGAEASVRAQLDAFLASIVTGLEVRIPCST